jgi:hypothetical protein
MISSSNAIPQREFPVLLPLGYTDPAGRVHRKAFLRKMTGHEEALFYDPALNAGQLVTELLHNCLIHLGDMSEVTPQIISSLTTADRNYLLLELRRITLGDRLSATYHCPRCGCNMPVVQDLSQVPVRRLADGEILAEINVHLDDGYIDREGNCHADLALTLPRGVDEEFVSPLAETDPLKAHDALVLRCIRRFGSLPPAVLEAYGVKILRDLTLGDRQRIFEGFNGQMPGADFRVVVHCQKCDSDFTAILDVTHFFAMS